MRILNTLAILLGCMLGAVLTSAADAAPFKNYTRWTVTVIAYSLPGYDEVGVERDAKDFVLIDGKYYLRTYPDIVIKDGSHDLVGHTHGYWTYTRKEVAYPGLLGLMESETRFVKDKFIPGMPWRENAGEHPGVEWRAGTQLLLELREPGDSDVFRRLTLSDPSSTFANHFIGIHHIWTGSMYTNSIAIRRDESTITEIYYNREQFMADANVNAESQRKTIEALLKGYDDMNRGPHDRPDPVPAFMQKRFDEVSENWLAPAANDVREVFTLPFGMAAKPGSLEIAEVGSDADLQQRRFAARILDSTIVDCSLPEKDSRGPSWTYIITSWRSGPSNDEFSPEMTIEEKTSLLRKYLSGADVSLNYSRWQVAHTDAGTGSTASLVLDITELPVDELNRRKSSQDLSDRPPRPGVRSVRDVSGNRMMALIVTTEGERSAIATGDPQGGESYATDNGFAFTVSSVNGGSVWIGASADGTEVVRYTEIGRDETWIYAASATRANSTAIALPLAGGMVLQSINGGEIWLETQNMKKVK